MQVRRAAATAVRLAAGTYPLLVFAVCRRGIDPADALELAILYSALGLPLVFLALWAAGAMAGQRRQLKWPLLIVLLLACGAAAWAFAVQLQRHYRWLFLIQDSAFFALLTYYFASSLRAGREPLCTFFAREVHRTLSPELLKYTRELTKVWVLFFVATGCISSLLFFFASTAIWAFFTNLLMPFLILGFFVLENSCRRFFLPPEDRIGLRGTFSAIRRRGLTGASRSLAAQPRSVA